MSTVLIMGTVIVYVIPEKPVTVATRGQEWRKSEYYRTAAGRGRPH